MFMLHGLGQLVNLNLSLTSDQYVALLNDNLQPFMDSMNSNNKGFLQHDNVFASLGAQVIQNWFEKHFEDFSQMLCPPQFNLHEPNCTFTGHGG